MFTFDDQRDTNELSTRVDEIRFAEFDPRASIVVHRI